MLAKQNACLFLTDLNSNLTVKVCDNIDTVLPGGKYLTTTTTSGTFPEGYSRAGTLIVVERFTSRYCKYTDASGNQADRVWDNTWSAWNIKTSNTDLAGKSLVGGQNLDDCMGRYRTANNGIVASLVNKPVSWTSGEITIDWYPADGTGRYGTQIIRHTSNGAVEVYTRGKGTGGWGDWEKYPSNTDLESVVNSLPTDGRIGLDVNTSNKVLAIYKGGTKIGIINYT